MSSILTLFVIGVSVRQCTLSDKTTELEKLTQGLKGRIEIMKSDSADRDHLSKTKDKEITKTKFYLDSLTDSLKVDKQTKNK